MYTYWWLLVGWPGLDPCPLCAVQRISKAINRRVEMVSSARAIKAGDTFSVKDIKVRK